MRDGLGTWLGGIAAMWCMVAAAQGLRMAAAREADPVAVLDAEFRALAGSLPPRGVIGYLELDDERGSVESLRMRHVAQYALAPRVVAFEVGPEFLIVPRGASTNDPDPRLKGFYPIASFRSGHRVFRRLVP
jgi:hypothetical protein